jgi:hypothetical protein
VVRQHGPHGKVQVPSRPRRLPPPDRVHQALEPDDEQRGGRRRRARVSQERLLAIILP